jgi:hypothetical protein
VKREPRDLLPRFACAALLVCAGCAARDANNAPAPKEHPAASRSAPEPEPDDPTSGGLGRGRGNSEGVEQAWRRFTEDGRYRLARAADMRYPAAADARWGNEWHSRPPTFVYAWGRPGFDTDKDHLVAIVVDTAREGPNNFGLVVFGWPAGGAGYRPYWVFEGRDLSRARLDAPSGYLSLSEASADGTSFSTCDIVWDARRRRFACVRLKD